MEVDIIEIRHKLVDGFYYKIESGVTLFTKLFNIKRYNILFYNSNDELVDVIKNVALNNIEKKAAHHTNYVLRFTNYQIKNINNK